MGALEASAVLLASRPRKDCRVLLQRAPGACPRPPCLLLLADYVVCRGCVELDGRMIWWPCFLPRATDLLPRALGRSWLIVSVVYEVLSAAVPQLYPENKYV